MGRYWSTDNGREGIFCFAEQSSNTPEQFGMYGIPTHMNYIVNKDDFDIDRLNELMKQEGLKDIDSYSKGELEDLVDNYYEKHKNCDLYLGLNIYLDILENDYCSMEAEL